MWTFFLHRIATPEPGDHGEYIGPFPNERAARVYAEAQFPDDTTFAVHAMRWAE